MAATVRGERQEPELGQGPFDLGSTTTTRPRSRLPEVLVGTLLVSVFALAGAWFYSTSTTEAPYLALRNDLGRGEVVERSDLTIYEINTDSPIRAVPAAAVGEIVGTVAATDLAAGTLITSDQFTEVSQIPTGFGVVGLDLSPGQFPSFLLRSGDVVRVIVIPSDARGDSIGTPEVLADRAEIVEIDAGGGRGRFVALTMDVAVADRVAVAASQNRVRLIQVPGTGGP